MPSAGEETRERNWLPPEEIFTLIAQQTGTIFTMCKDELAAVWGFADDKRTDDSHIFDEMDTDNDGMVSRHEWNEWLEHQHDTRGEEWIEAFLRTCGERVQGKMDTWAQIENRCDEVFTAIAAQTGHVGVMDQDELVSACGMLDASDQISFDLVDVDKDGFVTRSEALPL